MRRYGTLAALLLVGSALAFASPASAEDFQQCFVYDEAELCLYDTAEGDREEACDEEGSGSYTGETRAEARVGDDAPRLDGWAYGREDCWHTDWGNYQRDRIIAQFEVCLEESRHHCPRDAVARYYWDGGIDTWTWVRTPMGDVSVSADWAGDCRGSILSPAGYESFRVDCPASPDDPNPGWGQIVPDRID